MLFVVYHRPREGEDPNRKPTAHEVLHAFGRHRGFMTAHGLPDNQKSSRIMLKDYVKVCLQLATFVELYPFLSMIYFCVNAQHT